jgi:surface carbohydrate biosynthesis protein
MPYVYLLVEESFRELASRQVIALDCLIHGFDVVIGQQWWFSQRLEELPPGIVLFKGNNRVQGSLMRAAKSYGHAVTSIEEEAFGTTYEPELKCFFDPVSIQSSDIIFTQCTIHRDFLRKWFPEIGEKIAIVGNPRTDVLLHTLGDVPRAKAAKLEAKHGDFILVNTNSSGVNPFDIDTYSYYLRCVDVGVIDPMVHEDIQRFESLMEWDHSNLREIARFIRIFAQRRADIPIILRPHPSENHRPWAENFAQTPNVHIVADRDHIPWILAARATVHTSCTTGLESRLLGTPAIGLCPGQYPWHAGFIANQVSDVSATAADAVEAVEKLFLPTVRSDKVNFDEKINQHLYTRLAPSLEISTTQRSSQRIADVFTTLQPEDSPRKTLPRHRGDVGLSGRRREKAHITSSTFKAQWASMLQALGAPEAAVIEEIAPAVFHLAPAA